MTPTHDPDEETASDGSASIDSAASRENLRARARALLDDLRRDGYTVPSERLYPFQWNWDSAFVALGLARTDPMAAAEEIETLSSAAWPNGMIPQIVFHERSDEYFPGPVKWGTEDEETPTSAITQPPLVVTAARAVYETSGDDAFLERVLSPLRRCLEWWCRERTDGDLVYVRHPWETGMDDSPAWHAPLDAMAPGAPEYDRADVTGERAGLTEQRPTDWEYDRYVSLVRQGKQLEWDEARLRRECPFVVLDVLTNALFVRACDDLAVLSEAIDDGSDGDPGTDTDSTDGGTSKNADDPDPADRWRRQAEATSDAMRERLWDDDLGLFVSWNLVADEPLRVASVAGLVPLFAGVPTDEQAERLVEAIERDFSEFTYRIPCYVGSEMNPDRYWRGPIWLNTNWLVVRGLRRYGYDGLADRIIADSLELVRKSGFREYYHPRTGTGRGSDRFAWSAALTLNWTADRDAE